MGDVVNLNQIRKARAKAEAEKNAKSNRVVHGTPKAMKNKIKVEKKKTRKNLDGKRIEDKDA